MTRHYLLAGENMHKITRWEFANSGVMATATVTLEDVGKVAYVEDNRDFHILVNHDPVTWKLLTAERRAPNGEGGTGDPSVYSVQVNDSGYFGSFPGFHIDPGTGHLFVPDQITAVNDPTDAMHVATKQYVDNLVAGLLDFKGNQDCSSNPNYPSALKGDAYYVSVAGKIGGASGKDVGVGDVVVASADNAGGNEATVGSSWFVMEANLDPSAFSLIGHTHTASEITDFNASSRAQTEAVLVAGTNMTITPSGSGASRQLTISAASGGVSDGDKGDVTVSGSGSVWTIGNSKVTYAKIANVTAARVLGRLAGSAGVIQELTGNQVLGLLSNSGDAGQVPWWNGSSWIPFGLSRYLPKMFVSTSDTVTASATGVDVTGLVTSLSASRTYWFKAFLMLKTASATVGPRPILQWGTGLTAGACKVSVTSSGSAEVFTMGNISANVMAPVGGLPNTTNEFYGYIEGVVKCGSTPSGTFGVGLASETAGTNVTCLTGSILLLAEVNNGIF